MLYNYEPNESFSRLDIIVLILLNPLNDEDVSVETGIICGGSIIVFPWSRNIVFVNHCYFILLTQ